MDLKNLLSYLDNYGELRLQHNSDSFIVMSNGRVVNNYSSRNRGFSARAYSGREWGFSSTSTLGKKEAKRAIQRAMDNAKFLSSRSGTSNLILPSRPIVLEKDLSTTKSILSVKEKTEYIAELNNYINKKYKDIASLTVMLLEESTDKLVATTDGAYFHTIIPRSYLRCYFTMKNDNEMITEYCVLGGLGNFEDYADNLEQFYADIEDTYKHLINKKTAVFADSGYNDVILGSDVTGILAHEAIGHTTEADLVRNGSIVRNLMGKQVASELVNLVDVPHTYQGKLCPRPVFVDDEGVEPITANIIEKGILKSYMHNKESAQLFGVQPTGNARASQYSDEPIIRMRNTYIEPGQSKLDDMIKSIDNGYYFMKPSNGQADSTSEFMFGVVRGYEIKNGKLGRALKETTISGVAVDLLKTVTAVSDDLHASGAGNCGKKQSIPVGYGGPALKCKINIGGK